MSSDEKNYKIIEKKHLFDLEMKLKFFGEGEWVNEVDFFRFEYLGYEACICRVLKQEPYAKEEAYFGGHLCGYVKIPQHHLYFGIKGLSDIDLECHGGITFNEAHQTHWIGFDCGHLHDCVPSLEHMRNTLPELIEIKKKFPIPKGMEIHPWYSPSYRNMGYCIEQCKSIIEQLKESNERRSSREDGEMR